MPSYSRFAAQEVALADDWSQRAVTEHTWAPGQPIGLGESGSIRVTRSDGICGVAKPAFQAGTDMPRAAHEKIASDLANILGIPVPPVTLWLNPTNQQLFAISALAFRQPLTWDQAGAMLTAKFRENALAVMAAGWVFHTWIADTDHGGNGGNVLIDAESNEDSPGIAFIDHAFSMSYNWNQQAAHCVPLPGYYAPIGSMPADAIADVVRKVQGVDTQTLRRLIDRVPRVYLPETRAKVIEECLHRRQTELVSAFGLA